VAQAERLLKVSQEGVAALLGPYGAAEPADDAALSEFTMCAPYAATVSERLVTPSERIALAQLVFVLANNDRLWVAAEIFERDWQLLALGPGAALEVTMPAFPGRTFAATVRHIGATVNTQTRSVPLVAEIENADGLLKPGMFAWVTLPAEEIRPRAAVPAEAVVRHEDQPFVFVPSGEATFRRVDVALGVETPEWVEVTSGLRAGDRVVTKGAFFLKSELLLQHEE
jgi:cobalt-zinc-cadmium efflux system membrane fusion protein